MRHRRRRRHSLTHLGLLRLTEYLEGVNFAAYVDLLQTPWRLALLNLIGGIFRGLGIGLGFTVIAGLVVLILQQLELLNLPIIGKWIADLVQIVDGQLRARQFTY
ncbi:DUF5665 domain-containing protein [Alicyclobacillus acidocaldarius]|uniref:Uncharacterized protein n=1 Tax=Alicyclobacillus acidocaldarius subsp. acidocaldarius (strain ATCC 27009 / DSM 446 / BCRC 14685 / JCM 5260 / KCTC 1825 / NBRC 15652 / NCIMB 11725 / NRRL B-14509 / 104-IA) TaxID=521098 RepID=C8WW55_ALIAD|nr:DUF5665 domain-containing protein [Alicyclobacillus acidocaldarius]ACV58327.1 hypothetical protein Aaci_1299 [Alicyclobacillus acidocaldarius subsp. acidocaldarius DSM 446]